MAEQSRFSVDSIESKRDESDEGEHVTNKLVVFDGKTRPYDGKKNTHV